MDDSTPIIDVTPHPSGFVPSDDVWAFFRRRKGSIALFWFLGLALALWWLMTRPHIYQAESRVAIVRTGAGGPVSEAELASEMELIRDPTHLHRAAALQMLNQSDIMIDQERRRIEGNLDVGPAGKSNILTLQYRDSDAARAAQVLNRVLDLYLAQRHFIFQPAARGAIEAAAPAGDLAAGFDAATRVRSLRSELDSRVQRRVELETRVAELRAQVRDVQESVAELRRRGNAVPDRIRSETRTRTSANPSNRQIEETESLNPLKQQIESELVKNESALAGLRARLDQTQIAVREAKLAEDKTTALATEREVVASKVQNLQSRLESMGRDTSATENSNLRATLISRAENPTAPVGQRYGLRFALALLAALLTALILAWLIDQFDRPIYTSGDFERASGVPRADDFARGAGA